MRVTTLVSAAALAIMGAATVVAGEAAVTEDVRKFAVLSEVVAVPLEASELRSVRGSFTMFTPSMGAVSSLPPQNEHVFIGIRGDVLPVGSSPLQFPLNGAFTICVGGGIPHATPC